MADFTSTVKGHLPATTVHTEDDTYALQPGATYTFNCDAVGGAVWEFWDGTAWVAYTAGTPAGCNFTADINEHGHHRLNWGSGSPKAGFTEKKT